MNASHFCWQPVAAVPCYFRVCGELSEVLPFLLPVFEKQQISEEALQSASEQDDTRLFEWKIAYDPAQNLWKAIPSGDLKSGFEATESSDLTTFVTQLEYGAVLRLFYHMDKRFFGLHSAFLSKNGRGIIVIGPKEAGKSTLSCALWQSGWRLHADDLTILDEKFQPHPNPRRISLRYSSRELLNEELWGKILAAPSVFRGQLNLLFHPHDVEEEILQESDSPHLSAIIFLARPGSVAGAAELQKLVPANSIFSFLPHSTLPIPPGQTTFTPDEPSWGQALPRLAALVERVPVYDLGRGPLDRMVTQIESLIC